jgi:anti-anti-sigma factor
MNLDDNEKQEKTMALTITTESSPHDSLSVKLDGQLNDETAEAFEKAVYDGITETLVTVVLDMKKLSFISSAGVGVIMKVKTHLNRDDRHLAMIYMPPAIEKVFEMIHLLPMMRSFVSEAHLDDYLTAVQEEIKESQDDNT